MIDSLVLSYLKFRRGRRLKGVEVDKPLELIREYIAGINQDSNGKLKLICEIFEVSADNIRPYFSESEDFTELSESISEKIKIFERKPYDLGGLDIEMNLVVDIICQVPQPNILEIGVANGYSSAFLYLLLSNIGGSITSVDWPRIYSEVQSFEGRLITSLAAKQKIPRTGTLGDILPGGVVPSEKYGGWLVPLMLRRKVSNLSIYGNAFSVLDELENNYFEVVVFDAMKDYASRIKIFEKIDRKLKVNGLLFVDGYWINSAFDDFCNRYNYETKRFGRVGLAVKR